MTSPRESSWVVHDHHGILGGLAAAFAVGRFHLRRAEDFFADLGLGARRALGLGRGSPCDTTLYRVLAGQSPVGFEETVLAQVKGHIARWEGDMVSRRRRYGGGGWGCRGAAILG